MTQQDRRVVVMVDVTSSDDLRNMQLALPEPAYELLLATAQPDLHQPSAQVDLLIVDRIEQIAAWRDSHPHLPTLGIIDPDDSPTEWLEAGASDVLERPMMPLLVQRRVRHAWIAHLFHNELERTSRREQELAQALQAVAAELNRSLTEADVWQAILRTISQVVPNDGANVIVVRDGEWEFVNYYSAKPSAQESFPVGLRLPIDQLPVAEHILRSRQAVLVRDTRQDTLWQRHTYSSLEWIRAYMGAPIIIHEEVAAIINIDHHRPGAFTESDLQRLMLFAHQAAIALQNARHYEESLAYARVLEDDVQKRTQELEAVNAALRQEIDERQTTEARLRWVLKSARCLLFSAVVAEHGQHSLEWTLEVANELAAQAVLPLKLQPGQRYVDAWRASILEEDWNRYNNIFLAHAGANKHDYSTELRCRDKNGALRHLLVNVQFEHLAVHEDDERIWSMVGVCTDITPLKDAEETLQRAKEQLERNVQERTIELLRTNQALLDEIAERRKAEAAERAQRVIAEALRSSSERLISTLDLDSVLDHLLRTSTTLIEADAANIMLLSDDKQTARIVRHQGYGKDLSQIIYDVTHYADKQAIMRSEVPYLIINVKDYPGWVDPNHLNWVCCELSVPIRIEDDIIGFLILSSRSENAFTHEQADWLQAFANQAGIALRNARYVERIRRHNISLNESVAARTAELDNERAQLRAVLDSIRDGVIYYDSDGEPQYLNQALIQMTGYEEREWLYHHIERDLYTDDVQRANALRQAMQTALSQHGYWEGDVSLRRKDGTTFMAHLTRAEVVSHSRGSLGYVTVVRDISAAKELEEQQSRFITSASHELRTPIANLKTRIYLMRSRPMDKYHQNHLDVIEQVTALMQRLVEDMFDYARFQRGILEIRPEPLNLGEFLLQVAQYHLPEVQFKQIELSVTAPDDPLIVDADPFRLAQVLNNLLANAIQYTNTYGTIRLILERLDDKQGQSQAVVHIQDSGRGIAPEHLPHLFKPFYRASDDTRGAGLGLAIAQDIVKRHGGTIDVQSKVGTGTRFTISLPLHQVEAL
ncbi:MAG: GAF domain-containing protein [Anaerolineae bacterium]|nr:GAF domain-containing protein [Anaerolineae bacterium]MDW8171673.1 GAF domain-containing protein [Anaerolineae bacterium]